MTFPGAKHNPLAVTDWSKLRVCDIFGARFYADRFDDGLPAGFFLHKGILPVP